MLKFMRKRQKSIIVWVVFLAIIVVFIFWGIGNFRVDRSGIAAKVDGKVMITMQDFTKAYQRQIEFYKRSMRENFSEELIERFKVKKMVLDGLINKAVILKEAKNRRVKVEKEELQKAIAKIPAFQKNGIFDNETYLQILSGMGMPPGEFEKAIEEEMTIEKFQNDISKNINVNDKDVFDVFKAQNRRINLKYAVIDGSQFEKGATVTDDEAKVHFEKNKENFRIPDRVKVSYIALNINDIKPKVQDEEIKSYYEKNIKAFERQKEVKARHMLFRIDKSKEDAKKKAEDVLALIKKGRDFSELAKKYSEDPGSAKNGGDLGYFKAGLMIKPFEDAAFSMKKGDVSQIIETEFGLHIIKVDDVKEAGLMPLNEARDEIVKILETKKASEMARALADAIQKEIGSGKDLNDAAKNKGIKVKETGYFSQRDKNEIARDEDFKKTLFSMKKGEVSRILEDKDGYYILKVLDRIDNYIPKYEEVSSSVRAVILKQKASEKARAKADEFLKQAKESKEDFLKLSQKNNYKTGETGAFTQEDGMIPKIAVFAEKDIFDLKKDIPYYPKVISSNNMFYVLKLEGVVEADEKEFEAKKDAIKNRLISQKKQEAFEKWLNETRAKAKIEINKEAM